MQGALLMKVSLGWEFHKLALTCNQITWSLLDTRSAQGSDIPFVQAVSSTYEAFGLGKHRHGGPLLDQSISLYNAPYHGRHEADAWLDSIAAACVHIRDIAPGADADAR